MKTLENDLEKQKKCYRKIDHALPKAGNFKKHKDCFHEPESHFHKCRMLSLMVMAKGCAVEGHYFKNVKILASLINSLWKCHTLICLLEN